MRLGHFNDDNDNNNNNNNNDNSHKSRCANSMKFSNAHHSLRVKILQSTKAMKRREYEWKVTTKTTSWLKDKFELP